MSLGACAIAEAVECLPDLIELDLGDCLIRTEGALRLATALKSCKKIKKVNFAFGEIKIDGALALVNSLPLDQLELLDLNGNKFGDEGCDQLQKLTQDLVCFGTLIIDNWKKIDYIARLDRSLISRTIA